jgi:hypothetical protein
MGPSNKLTPSSIDKFTDEHFPDWLEQKVGTS